MPQTQHPAVGLLFVLFLIWLLFPDGEYQTQSPALPDLAAQRLARYRDALGVLGAGRWGDFAPRAGGGGGEDGGGGPARPGSYVNLTGFRAEDGFAWEDLGRFRARALQLSRHAVPPVGGLQLWDAARGAAVWANASGSLRGEWVRRPGSVARRFDSYNLSRSVPAMDWIGDGAAWARNVTGPAGRMMLRLEANKTVARYDEDPGAGADADADADAGPLSGGLIRNVKATATIEDTTGSGLGWEMRLWGVHWPRQGVVLMATTSEKFEGIFGLPHLAPGPAFFRSSQQLLNQTLARVLDAKRSKSHADQAMPWSSDVDNPLYTAYPSPHCEFVVYAQVHPPLPDLAPESALRAIEAELENPQGAPVRAVPPLHVSAVAYSPDCAFFLETKGPPDFPPGEGDHLVGMKTEVHTHHVKTWMLVYALVVLAQVRLLKNQMREACTPSTMARISFWTVSAMAVVDGMTFTAAATWVSSAAATFLPTLALMFASFLSMTIGGSFLAKIHEVQLPEGRGRREPGPILPGPVTAPASRPPPRPPSEPPVVVPADQDVDAEIADAAAAVPRASPAAAPPASPPPQPPSQTFQAIIGRFILFSLCLSFLAISSTTWYPRARALFLNLCAAAYLSLWLPQIHRNTVRNCRRALRWQFVAGQSALRLLPVAYFWAKEDNFLYARPDRPAFALLCAWLWLQLLVLAAQEVLGPRFGLPAGWAPDAWDYHPVLREDGVEAGGLPIGLGAEKRRASVASSAGSAACVRAIDCAICREALEVPVVRAGDDDGSVAGVFARRLYMVTPCRHIFHTACLEGWMRFRLQCPICREELPPI